MKSDRIFSQEIIIYKNSFLTLCDLHLSVNSEIYRLILRTSNPKLHGITFITRISKSNFNTFQQLFKSLCELFCLFVLPCSKARKYSLTVMKWLFVIGLTIGAVLKMLFVAFMAHLQAISKEFRYFTAYAKNHLQ